MEREWTKPSSLVLIAGILVVLNILGMNWFMRLRARSADQEVPGAV